MVVLLEYRGGDCSIRVFQSFTLEKVVRPTPDQPDHGLWLSEKV